MIEYGYSRNHESTAQPKNQADAKKRAAYLGVRHTKRTRIKKNMKLSRNIIRKKFGDDYMADERTFIMGIDQRFTKHFADRYIGLNVLETCTGAGFTTLSLARTAKHVFTVEIDEVNQEKAINNIKKAGEGGRTEQEGCQLRR